MSSTTQILFNSPALHSLKRDQLVKLCKIHAIKASGKNVELIEKLKRHAETLPKDDPLSIAVRGETNENDDDDDNESDTGRSSPTPSPVENPILLPRPSEQWEMVMDSIAEEDENQGSIGSMKTIGSGTRGTAGEFGTDSTKTSTMTSSIKALANSLGLKRGGSSKTTVSSVKSSASAKTTTKPDELERHSTRYSALPPSEPVTILEQPRLAFNPSRMSMNGALAEGETPLPGHALRPGIPAPANGRLSMGLGLGVPTTPSQPTTTIRLVANRTPPPNRNNFMATAGGGTPQLKPFHTTFDLIMGSPAPASAMYPTLTFHDLPPAMPTNLRQSEDFQLMEGVTSAPIHNPVTNSPIPRTPEPFIFGSPLPQHRVSDVQFKSAAASVLEEMNKRLQQEGVDGVDTSLIGRLHPGASNAAELKSRELKPLPRPRGEVQDQFDQKHEQEFQKMEGIDGFMKRRVAARAGEAGPVLAGKKRKSSVIPLNDSEGPRRPIGARRASGTRVVSKVKHARPVIPGAFGEDDDDDDEEDRQTDKRAGKRIRMASDASQSKDGPSTTDTKPSEDEERDRDRERQAIKRKLEMNKARRRSSTAPGGMHNRRSGRLSGRVSGGLTQQKSKPSRFGFLSSAKSLVQSVWNRGKPAPAASNAGTKPPAQPWRSGTAPEKKAPAGLLKKPALATAKSSTLQATATSSRVSSSKVDAKNIDSQLTKPTAASSARSRSPALPTVTAQSIRSSLAQNGLGTQASRNSVAQGSTRKSSVIGTSTSRVSSAGNVSSIGTRLSSTRGSSAGTVGSMGKKKSSLALATRPSTAGSSSSRLSTSSRLHAPTASSLAKSNRTSVAGLKVVSERSAPSSLPVRSPPPPPMASFSSLAARSKGTALGVITNSPAVAAKSPGDCIFSPSTRGKIFSRPLELPSAPTGIPTPIKKRDTSTTSSVIVSPNEGDNAKPPVRTSGVSRSLSGRKPRISRSKVIAKLASQRAATSGSGPSATATSAFTPKRNAKARSSLGAKVAARSSFGGAGKSKARASAGGGDVLLSAKKRARQSEYMRRRSRVGATVMSPGAGGVSAMDVDES